jgi:U11/U12 small nuclear ribonucleoprotein SNRNP65
MAMTTETDQLFSSNNFKRKLFERLNGISAAFNVNYPISAKLRYEYPPINATTLENIASALISNPKFYTQTLHLMNKMNLPCPLVSFVRRPLSAGHANLYSK